MNEQEKECVESALRTFAQQNFCITFEGLASYVKQWYGHDISVDVIASYIQEQIGYSIGRKG